VQLGQENNQILQTAAQSVHGPGHDHVEFPTRGVAAQLVECWPLIAAPGAADAVIQRLNLANSLIEIARAW